ncbi:hypothetical protein CLOHYLEM_07197 [[Clostridium] hylemonae DSM 15053]|uniref:Uncharacterized protein n=1 Tax=[Clostridium] hylemonae DSM 15053 TaxID=553973 RepID=C0C529_9FIRM|nr:hypothetical protein [[Clostridium] hylemonae]EEG72797.1 hypothetical protein CLOHYLEM_07197 [[Clostridium] hylemonae DSM 15053]
MKQLEEYNELNYKRLKALGEMQKQQLKCLSAMLNHQITRNVIDNIKRIHDDWLESIFDK